MSKCSQARWLPAASGALSLQTPPSHRDRTVGNPSRGCSWRRGRRSRPAASAPDRRGRKAAGGPVASPAGSGTMPHRLARWRWCEETVGGSWVRQWSSRARAPPRYSRGSSCPDREAWRRLGNAACRGATLGSRRTASQQRWWNRNRNLLRRERGGSSCRRCLSRTS